MSWFGRLFRRANTDAPPRGPVEMDLHQQLIARALYRFGPCTFVRLHAEVEAIRPASQAEMANAILKMEASGVIDRLPERDTTQAQRPYTLTRRGRRICRYIPQEPRSAMQFYV